MGLVGFIYLGFVLASRRRGPQSGAAMSTINITNLNVYLTDHHFYGDTIDRDAGLELVDGRDDHEFASDAFDQGELEGEIDPPLPDEQPETAGLDEQQEIAANIAAEIADVVAGKHSATGEGTIITRSWLEAIVLTALANAQA